MKPHCKKQSRANNKGKSGRSEQRTCHHRLSGQNMADVALTLPTHCCHPNESHPLQPHSPAPLVTCMHSHHTTHNPLQTTNVLHRTPEGTPTGLVHTHHVTSSGVQSVLINNEPDDINMTVLSCTVDHNVPIVVSAVELGLHFRSQVADDIDMATHCSMV